MGRMSALRQERLLKFRLKTLTGMSGHGLGRHAGPTLGLQAKTASRPVHCTPPGARFIPKSA